jgi:hypothetical protein
VQFRWLPHSYIEALEGSAPRYCGHFLWYLSGECHVATPISHSVSGQPAWSMGEARRRGEELLPAWQAASGA